MSLTLMPPVAGLRSQAHPAAPPNTAAAPPAAAPRATVKPGSVDLKGSGADWVEIELDGIGPLVAGYRAGAAPGRRQ
jgi:hypothetical protein